MRFNVTELAVLLVASSIVGLTGAAALSESKERSDDGLCLSHLRRLSVGLAAYSHDNDGTLPLSLTRQGLWMDLLDPYTSSTREQRMAYDLSTPYHCPTALKAHPVFNRTNGNTFGINGFTVGRQDYIGEAKDWVEMDVVRQFRWDRIKNPRTLAAFGDGHWNEERNEAIQRVGEKSWIYSIETHAWAFPERLHSGGANFAFYDGHAKHVADIPLQMRNSFWWPTRNQK